MAQESLTAQIDRLAEEAWAIRRSDMRRARELAEQVIALLPDDGAYPQGEADALKVLAWCKLHMGQLVDALPLALRALDLYRQLQQPDGQAYAAYLLGLSHWRMNDLYNALEHIRLGLEVAHAAGERQHEMALYILLGGVYCDQGDYEEAIRAHPSSTGFGDRA